MRKTLLNFTTGMEVVGDRVSGCPSSAQVLICTRQPPFLRTQQVTAGTGRIQDSES